MIRDFEAWNNNLGEASSLQELKGTRVAIEAADYLFQRVLGYGLPRAKEPLLPAIGGLPLTMKHQVESDLQQFKQYNIEPLFIFSGLEYSKTGDEASQRATGVTTNQAAWEYYDRHDPDQAVSKFGESKYVMPEDLFRGFQCLLNERKVAYQVAPYSSWAQIAYLEKNCKNYVQAVAGSSELLLFDCDRIITSWDFDNGDFKWIQRSKCVAEMKRTLGNSTDVTDAMFVDACLLAGTSLLPTLHHLDSSGRKGLPKPQAALDLMMSFGRSGLSVAMNFQDNPRFQNAQYAERYRKARFAIQHHPVLTVQGKVEPMDNYNAPNDVHEFIGQRLPDELYHYLSRGIIGSRILNWRASGEIVEVQPLDGGDAEEYRKLVSQKLTPLRASAMSVLSSPLHRFYQHKDIKLKCWFDGQTQQSQATQNTINARDLPDHKPMLAKWNVRGEVINDALSRVKGRGAIGTALLSLKDTNFANKTITEKDKANPKVLSTNNEVLYNSIWRFLALREYVNDKHTLTSWGELLATIITSLDGNKEQEEAAVIAVELLRFGLLTPENIFAYSGAPMRGTDTDRRNNLMISRVASLGSLNHKPIGFTGPLSRHLLAYHSIVSAVRNSLRDLAEVSMTALLLNGDANRDLPDPFELGMSLPFLVPNTCALSIAVKSYLDELLVRNDKATVKETASQTLFPQSQNLVGDLDVAFKFWDAIYTGVKSSGSLIRDKKVWDEANEWLADKR